MQDLGERVRGTLVNDVKGGYKTVILEFLKEESLQTEGRREELDREYTEDLCKTEM